MGLARGQLTLRLPARALAAPSEPPPRPRTPFGHVAAPAPRRGTPPPPQPGQRLTLRRDLAMTVVHRDATDHLHLRKGTVFVVLKPPDDDHPEDCLVEAEGVVWGWVPLRSLKTIA